MQRQVSRRLRRVLCYIAMFISVTWTWSDGMCAAECQYETQAEVDDLMRQAAQLYTDEQYDEAIALYRQAADCGNAWGQNNVAWLYATFKDARLRDGKLAVYYARQATEQEPRNSHFFRTLAAAYARNGQFDKAVEAQRTALELLSDDTQFSEEVKAELRVDNERKLRLYQQHKAVVDEH